MHINDFGDFKDEYPIKEPIRNYYLLSLIFRLRNKTITKIDLVPEIGDIPGETSEDDANENFNIDHRITEITNALKHYENIKKIQEEREKIYKLLTRLRGDKWPQFIMDDKEPEKYDIVYQGGSLYYIYNGKKLVELEERYLLEMLGVKFGIVGPDGKYFGRVIWQI